MENCQPEKFEYQQMLYSNYNVGFFDHHHFKLEQQVRLKMVYTSRMANLMYQLSVNSAVHSIISYTHSGFIRNALIRNTS